MVSLFLHNCLPPVQLPKNSTGQSCNLSFGLESQRNSLLIYLLESLKTRKEANTWPSRVAERRPGRRPRGRLYRIFTAAGHRFNPTQRIRRNDTVGLHTHARTHARLYFPL